MRTLILLLTLFLINSAQAQGLLNSVRKRVTETVNSAVEEVRSTTNREVNSSTDGIVEEAIPNTTSASASGQPSSQPGASANQAVESPSYLPPELSWSTPPVDGTRALDVEVQGLRIGMPELFVDKILRERGYESRTLQVYTKQELNDAGQLLRRWNISYQTVEPTQEFIDELEEPLKSMVLEAQQIINAGSQSQAGSGRDRNGGASPQTGRAARTMDPDGLERTRPVEAV